MKVIRFLYFIVTIVAVAKSSAEVDNGSVSVLTQSLIESKHIVRGSGSIDESEEKDEETNVNRSPKRMLEAGTKRLLQLKSINGYDDCCNDNDDDDDNYIDNNDDYYYNYDDNYDDEGDDNDDDDDGKDFVASDSELYNSFGSSCSMANDLVVIGSPGVDEDRGAAYLFHMDGTEVAKLIPGYDGEEDDRFGESVAMDEKVVVGSTGGYVRVFSRDGTYERTIRCDDCSEFGFNVATLGNLMVTDGIQNSIYKLFLYTKEGELIKSFEQEHSIYDVAISEQFIVSTAKYGKTIIYSNTSPDFPKIAEIEQGGWRVAVAENRFVIGDLSDGVNHWDGVAYLFKTDGTLIKTLDRQDASSGSQFGGSVAITNDKVIVSASGDDDGGENTGSVFIYSAVTGEFLEKILAPDGEGYFFGSSVCASGSYYVVGAGGPYTGAAYLFQLP